MAPAVAGFQKCRQQHRAFRCYSSQKQKMHLFLFFIVFAFAVGYPLQSLVQRSSYLKTTGIYFGIKMVKY